MASSRAKPSINDEISASSVRLIDAQGNQAGIVPLAQALAAATKAVLDLVEIAPQSQPPVCKLMDYGKYIFDAKKQRSAARRKQKQMQVKEIKFRPTTDTGDYDVKLRNLKRFLEHGDKAKVTVRFRGREMAHQDLGGDMLRRIEADLTDIGQVEQFPKLEGRQLTMLIAPKSRKHH